MSKFQIKCSCIKCKRETTTSQLTRNHLNKCPEILEKRTRVAWNKGLIGDERCRHSEESKKKMSESFLKRTPEWHAENGKRISKTINKKVANGEWHTSLAKNMHIDYKGNDLHGSWELLYAKFLDDKNIRWIRNRIMFDYFYEGKNRKYTPDFYLLDTNEYVEIKGYKTDKDDAKWNQFPSSEKLVILMESELKSLGIIPH